MERYLEPADAAGVLGITPQRVRDLARRGVLPVAATTPRGARLFRAEDVERLARERAARRDQAAAAVPAGEGERS